MAIAGSIGPFDRDFVCSLMIGDEIYLRVGQLPKYHNGTLTQEGDGQFCVFVFDARAPENVDILGSASTIEYALAIFDRELKARGFATSR